MTSHLKPLLGEQGVRIGHCKEGDHAGCVILVSELEGKGAADVAFLVEYSGKECFLECYETTADSREQLAAILKRDEIEWLPDTPSTLHYADQIFPYRFVPRGWKGV